jgi:hypothetical protein
MNILKYMQVLGWEQDNKNKSNRGIQSCILSSVLNLIQNGGTLIHSSMNVRNDEELKITVAHNVNIIVNLANMLNVELADELQATEKTLASIGERLKENNPATLEMLVIDSVIKIGQMAKVCEALDHLESIDYRQEMKKLMVNVLEHQLIICCLLEESSVG